MKAPAALGAALVLAAPGALLQDSGATPLRLSVERVVEAPAESSFKKVLGWIAGPAADRREVALVRPYGVAWDGPDLLVTDPGAARVFRFDRKGRARVSAVGLFEGPIGVAACGDRVVVTDSRLGSVTSLDRDLKSPRRLAEGLVRPTGIACSGLTLLVAETGLHRVLVMDADGRRSAEIGRHGSSAGELNFPAALAVGKSGLLVGDTMNFRVQSFAIPGGSFLGAFGALGDAPGETPRIKGIAVDPEGRVFVTDGLLDAIGVFASDGRFLASFGSHGPAPGQFALPAGIALDREGRLAIADSLNGRVQVLRMEPSPDNGGRAP